MKQFRNFIVILSMLAIFSSCNQGEKKAGYTVNGSIKGVENGVLLLRKDVNDPNPTKFEIKDGKFSFSGEAVSEPTSLQLAVEEGDMRFGFYVENGVNTFEGEIVEHEQFKGHKFKGHPFFQAQ